MAGWMKVPLDVEVGLSPGDVVLDGDPAPPRKGHSIPTSAHVYCGQTAGWITMPVGMEVEVDLGLGHIVLDGDPAPPERSTAAPLFFGPCVLWPNGRSSQLLLSTCTVLPWLPDASHQLLPNATHFTPSGPENPYTLHHAFIGNSTQLQRHDSVHLSSAYTDYSFSSYGYD